MRIEEIHDLITFISREDKNCATDFVTGLDLLQRCLESSLAMIKDRIVDAMANNRFEELSCLGEYCKVIKYLDHQINDCNLAVKQNKKPIKASVAAKKGGEVHNTAKNRLVDADTTKKHTTDENFEHCRICRLVLRRKEFVVSSWNGALLDVCAYLYAKDPEIMKSFVDDPAMNGDKCPYFSYSDIRDKDGKPRNHIIKDSSIYVWTNQDANDAVRLIRKASERYGYAKNEIAIYLRSERRIDTKKRP